MTEPIYNRVRISEQEEVCRRLAESKGYAVRPEDVFREQESGAGPDKIGSPPTDS